MTTILTKKKDTTGAPAPGDLTNAAGGAEPWNGDHGIQCRQ